MKNLLNLGKALNKAEQKSINGGTVKCMDYSTQTCNECSLRCMEIECQIC